MSGFLSGDSTFPPMECHALSVFLAHFRGQWIGPMTIQVCFSGLGCLSLRISTIGNQWPHMLSTQKFTQLSLVGCTMDWHSCRPGSKLIKGYHTSKRLWSFCCIICYLMSLWGERVETCGAPEMGDLLKGSVSISKYPCSTMSQRYANDLQSNNHCWAQNQVQRGAFAGYLQIEMVPFSRCPVHASDISLCMFSFGG